MSPTLISSTIARLSTFSGSIRKAFTTEKQEEFLVSNQAISQAGRDAIILEKLLPANLLPRIEIESIGLLAHNKGFNLSEHRSLMHDRCQRINSENYINRIEKNSSELPGSDFARRLEALIKAFSLLHKDRNNSVMNKKINDCYQELSSLKYELLEYYLNQLSKDDFPNKSEVAKRIASAIPADELSIPNLKILLEHNSAPLIATSGGLFDRIIPVKYNKELLELMLSAEKFNPLSRRYEALIPEKSLRHVAMITNRDSYTKEALDLLIYDQNRQIRPEVLTAILIRQPKLITDFNLSDIFAENLPFNQEQNGLLIQKALKQKTDARIDQNLYYVLSGNELLLNPENIKAFFKIEDDIKARHIALLANLFKYEYDRAGRTEWFS